MVLCDVGLFPLARFDGGADVVKVLFEPGAKVDSREQLGKKTALHCAAISGKQETMRVLMA